MYSVTNHAIRRYSERILGIKTTKKEYDNIMKDIGVNIIETMTDMMRNSDLISAQSRTRYYLYRNIVLIVRDDCIVTVYKIHNEFNSLEDYTNYINATKETIIELTKKHQQFRFDNNKDDMCKMLERIKQYENLLFHSSLTNDGK